MFKKLQRKIHSYLINWQKSYLAQTPPEEVLHQLKRFSFSPFRYAASLNNLALLYDEMGRYADAEPLFLQAKEIRKVQLGENHPHYATSLNNLAGLMAATDCPHEAFQLMQEAAQIKTRIIGEILSISSDRQRLEYMQQNQSDLYVFLSLVTQYLPQDAAGKRAGLDLVLRRKGLATEAGIVLRTSIYGGRYPHLKPEFEKLRQLTQQRAYYTWQVPTQWEGLPAYREQLAQLTREQEEVERSLSRQIPEMNLQVQLNNASRHAIADILPEGSTLVEFARFQVYNFKAVKANGDAEWLPARYLAFVLSAGDAEGVEMVDLGEAEDIDRLCRRFRKSVSGEGDRALDLGEIEEETPVGTRQLPHIPETFTTPEGQALYRKLIHPLKPYLQPQQTLYIAPDGELATLPFGILSAEGTAYLMAEYALRYLSGGRDLLRFNFPIPVNHTAPLAIANPDYNLRVETGETPPSGQSENFATQTPGAGGRDMRSLSEELQRHKQGDRFKPLPGTKIEAENIAQLLDVPIHTEAQAVKSLLSQCHSPKIVHIATHGYFLENVRLPLPSFPMSPSPMDFAGLQDPMTRSGLAFAGANTALQAGELPAEAEDALLTAQGALTLDLTGTQLVVLSACDTALGDLAIGEGVLGLRRSLILAGAETVVMSLWKVPDVPTAILMKRFYQNVLDRGMPRTKALEEAQAHLKYITVAELRQHWLTEAAIAAVERVSYPSAQLLCELRQKPDRDRPFLHPQYWAAFVSIGNPGAMHSAVGN
ncbi:CHAT domain-containing protein [Phormidium sp. CCY1219]|uniref:CHAT domain-containing protein n=1 Tax=Phormidium sp. CCY1219 TaxID=2886104 RepID=UPI002D1E9F47|nr:CHAT domain-containing tetratricopeptide repeat protein [Phormidium sp. CCY1219]MEB3827856.1 CHAT domain-containing protein [Phormidium sp. CCY1219]